MHFSSHATNWQTIKTIVCATAYRYVYIVHTCIFVSAIHYGEFQSSAHATTEHNVYSVLAITTNSSHVWCFRYRTNDPSAGSPTETLLRLLLPLSDKVYTTLYCNYRSPLFTSVRIIYRATRSVGATGGVYKGQGRNRHWLMTSTY